LNDVIEWTGLKKHEKMKRMIDYSRQPSADDK